MPFTMKQYHSTFNESWYKQINVVAMDSHHLDQPLLSHFFVFMKKYE